MQSAFGARRRDVEPVRAVEKVHAARRVLGRRRRQRHDDDGRLLALELVDGADAHAGQPLRERRHLRVVRRDDHEIAARRAALPRPSRCDSARRRAVSSATSAAIDVDLFVGARLIARRAPPARRRAPRCRAPRRPSPPARARLGARAPARTSSRLFVERLGRERADVGVQPPRLVQEQAAIRAQWSSRRRAGARAPTPPAPGGWLACCGCSSCCGSPSSTRLFAPADTASTSASDICPASSMNSTSTLSRNAVVRPEPRRAAEQAILVASRTAARCDRCRRSRAAPRDCRPCGLAFVQALEIREPLLRRALAHGAQHVANRLVADGRDADLLPGLHELENHVRAREGLAGAGRTLNRQHAVVELEREPDARARPRRRRRRARRARPRPRCRSRALRAAANAITRDRACRAPSARRRSAREPARAAHEPRRPPQQAGRARRDAARPRRRRWPRSSGRSRAARAGFGFGDTMRLHEDVVRAARRA